MNTDILTGTFVKLRPTEPDKDAELVSAWANDSEFDRFLDADPAVPYTAKSFQEFAEKEGENWMEFMICLPPEDKPIGFVGLSSFDWVARNCWVGIGIGERDLWGKGYGTDAMRIILRLAFRELNLNRVNLSVFAYNPRAIRSYEKAGFVVEGAARGFLHRDGKRSDLVYMGVLRREWEQLPASIRLE